MLDFRIIGISPFRNADPNLVTALSKTEALGVLDLGSDAQAASIVLDALIARRPRRFGVLMRPGVTVEDLPEEAVVVLAGPDYPVADWAPRTVLAQVTSLEEARAAVSAGAAGLIAKGTESGGRVGEETAFVLLQRLVREVDVPVWAQGGIGPHTAGACVAGGARGVVVDSQLALVRESRLAPAVKEAIASMDGSETITYGGYRFFTRPDLKGLVPERPEAVAERLGASDLTRELLPAGQDAAFAADLAERCVTAGDHAELFEFRRDPLGAPRRITYTSSGETLNAAYSPDGNRIAITSSPLGLPQIYVMSTSGGAQQLISRYVYGERGYATSPDWAPENGRIAYQAWIENSFQVVAVSPDGSDRRVLTSAGSNEDPSWAPDGRHLVFASAGARGRSLLILDTVSGRVRTLTSGQVDQLPDWSPPLR